MTNDIISQAEALLGRFAALKEHAKIKPNSVMLEMIDIREALIEMVPGLMEEIKRLRVLECAAKANMTRRDEDIGDLMKELAKWQQIAIEERAQRIISMEPEAKFDLYDLQECPKSGYACDENDGYCVLSECPSGEFWKQIAAKELGLQGYKTNGPIEINGERYVKESEQKAYTEQLEKDFIFYARSYEYLRDPDKWRPHQERYEKAERKAQAALEKIRRG